MVQSKTTTTIIDTINESVDEKSYSNFLNLDDLDEGQLNNLLGPSQEVIEREELLEEVKSSSSVSLLDEDDLMMALIDSTNQ
jgi:negative regulator of sigma E activity